MVNSSSFVNPIIVNETFVDRIIDAACEKYEQFDNMSFNVAAHFMGHSVKKFNQEDPKLFFVATTVKVVVSALAVLAAFAIIANPILVISSIIAGFVVHPEENTRKSIESWIKDGYAKVIIPIMINEDLAEKVALGALAVAILGATLTTVVAPVSIGLASGYNFRSWLQEKETNSSGAAALAAASIGENVSLRINRRYQEPTALRISEDMDDDGF